MSENAPFQPFLPVPVAPAAPRPSLARSNSTSAFVSQLLAARDRLPVQRTKRTTTPDGAVGAYSSSAKMAQKRMPQGYRKTVVI